MTTTVKLFADKMGGNDATAYIGSKGDVFLDQNSTTLRVSNGLTPGGISIGIEEVSEEVLPKLQAYEAAVEGWKTSMAQEVQHPGRTFLQWQVNGENVDEYQQILTQAWSIQQNSGGPSSPPSSPPSAPQPLMFVPAISAALYNQLRAQLAYIRGQYDFYLEALSKKRISGSAVVLPPVIEGELEEDLTIHIKYSVPSSPAGTYATVVKTFVFKTNGDLLLSDGTPAISVEKLQLIVNGANDFAGFKSGILAL